VVGTGAAILVIDDDLEIRESIAACLEWEGFQVESAAGGAEGLASLRRARPAVIVCDVQMPGMTGPEFLARLRADAGLRDIPVVLMSGTPAVAGRTTSGADAHLPKPFDLDELLATVRRLAV
jgi:CheY-like chemotaxis protein